MCLLLATLATPGAGGLAEGLPLLACRARLQWVFLNKRPPLGLPTCPLECCCQPSVHFRQVPASHPLHPTSSLTVSPAVRVLSRVPLQLQRWRLERRWSLSKVTQQKEFENAVPPTCTLTSKCHQILLVPPQLLPHLFCPWPSDSHSLTPPLTFTPTSKR